MKITSGAVRGLDSVSQAKIWARDLASVASRCLPRDASATKGDHLGPKIAKHLKKIVRTKTVHTSGTFIEQKIS